ncbi:MAG: Ig-like domain repeat protein, partial [Acidimicrobiales bacterium]
GYTFEGWFTASSGGAYVGAGGSSYTPTASVTLFAQWTSNIGTSILDLLPENPSSVVVGSSVVYTAYVNNTSGNSPLTGNVTFYVNGVAVPGCTNQHLLGGESANCDIDFPNAGTFTVTATYANDPKNATSTDSSTQDVTKGNTSLSLSRSSSITVGGTVKYTADVDETSGSGPLTGTVTFTDNGVNITGCASIPVGNGTVSCSVSFLSAGNVTIAATYSGSSNFNGSTASLSQQVNKGSTSLTLSPSTPVLSGATVVYSASVVETSGSGSLTGSVSYTQNGVAIAGCQNLALVSPKCSVHFTSTGTFSIVATYSNDNNFAGSSGTVSQVVGTKPVIASSNSVSARVGHSFSFQVVATGSPTPTLSYTGALPHGVTFNSSTGVLSGTPANGTRGTYSITVVATNSLGLTSQVITLTVTQ